MPKPTIVLVHGAWADGSSWNAVATELHKQGFSVHTPTNVLRGGSMRSAPPPRLPPVTDTSAADLPPAVDAAE